MDRRSALLMSVLEAASRPSGVNKQQQALERMTLRHMRKARAPGKMPSAARVHHVRQALKAATDVPASSTNIRPKDRQHITTSLEACERVLQAVSLDEVRAAIKDVVTRKARLSPRRTRRCGYKVVRAVVKERVWALLETEAHARQD